VSVRTLKELRERLDDLSSEIESDEDSVLIVMPGEAFPVELELYLLNVGSSVHYEQLVVDIGDK